MPTQQGLVVSPQSLNRAYGDTPNNTYGRQGDSMVSELHGKYYQGAYAGNVFYASTLAAGIIVPFNAATVASKFTLWNPAGSGVNVELIELTLCQVPGTALITGLGMGFQGPLASTGGVPTSLTLAAGGNITTKIGSGLAPKASLYTAATLTNVAISNLSPIYWLLNNVATTVITQGQTIVPFDGKFLLPPDTLCTLVNSITGTQSACAASICWAEWPQ